MPMTTSSHSRKKVNYYCFYKRTEQWQKMIVWCYGMRNKNCYFASENFLYIWTKLNTSPTQALNNKKKF